MTMLVNKTAWIPLEFVKALIKDCKKRGRRMRDKVLWEEKQPDNEWVLDFISDSDDDDFVTKKPKDKRALGGRRAPATGRTRPGGRARAS